MDSGWLTIIINSVPFLILIGLWVWMGRKGGLFGRSRQALERNLVFMERQEQFLERIALALEERNRQAR